MKKNGYLIKKNNKSKSQRHCYVKCFSNYFHETLHNENQLNQMIKKFKGAKRRQKTIKAN